MIADTNGLKNGQQRTYTDMKDHGHLLFQSGGYRTLKSFQLAQLCFDITVRFVELYIPKNSRTVDQMVQAARSGVQNIAEGSVASATSKRTELKLTNVARASLEELRLDYEDYLRQHTAPLWSKEHPLTQEFISCRVSTMADFRTFVQNAKQHPSMSVEVRTCPLQSVIVANAVLLLLNVTCHFLDRQLARLSSDFENEGGFSERMYQQRLKKRKNDE